MSLETELLEIQRSKNKVLNEFYETELKERIGEFISENSINLFLLQCNKTAKFYDPESGQTTPFKFTDRTDYVMMKNKKAIALDGTRIEIIFE